MSDADQADQQGALATFLQLVQIDSPSGQEAAVADHVRAALERCGVAARTDASGNVIGRRPGKGRGAARPPLLLSAHLDTVQPGIGVRPVIEAGIVRSSGTTILGADDKAGVAAILEALRRTFERAADYCPVEVVFTVQEETGLGGSKALDLGVLASREAVVLDSTGEVGVIVNQAPASNHLDATLHGKAAHAGVAPELGISAVQLAAHALARMKLGRINAQTTANIGVIAGGTARNIVPDRVTLSGETRSHDEAQLEAQTRHMVDCLEHAAQTAGGRADVTVTRAYGAINIRADRPLVAAVSAAMRRCGVEPLLQPTGGGSDANIFNAAGIEALNLGVGFEGVHTVEESIPVAQLARISDVVTAILVGEGDSAFPAR